MKKVTKMTFKYNFFQYVWIFIAGCYIGYGIETLWCLIKNGYIESRKALVLGHLSVAYGMGAVLLTIILVNFEHSQLWKVFLIAFLSGTVVEYICSWGQETFFHTVAWDYSHLPLNINGRVCLLYSLFWGALGVAWVKMIIPLFTYTFDKVNIPFEHLIIYGFVAFFIFDAALSASAGIRMNQRKEGIEPRNRYEQFLDTHYDDETMHKIYANSVSADND